jgi:hypothetical protein
MLTAPKDDPSGAATPPSIMIANAQHPVASAGAAAGRSFNGLYRAITIRLANVARRVRVVRASGAISRPRQRARFFHDDVAQKRGAQE